MQSFTKKLKEMGYEKVELIDTTNGKWIRKSEAGWMGLAGSALLTTRFQIFSCTKNTCLVLWSYKEGAGCSR